MSRLEKTSKTAREMLLSKNEHNVDNEYNSSNPDAISDGDDYGKESIGGITDIKTRSKLIAKNKFNTDNEYNSSNA